MNLNNWIDTLNSKYIQVITLVYVYFWNILINVIELSNVNILSNDKILF